MLRSSKDNGIHTQTRTAKNIEAICAHFKIGVCHPGKVCVKRNAKCGYQEAWTFRAECSECNRTIAGSQYTAGEIIAAHRANRVSIYHGLHDSSFLIERTPKK